MGWHGVTVPASSPLAFFDDPGGIRMCSDHIVRAWKDADFRAQLSAESAAAVPAHPVGDIDIADSLLEISGGDASRTEYLESLGCCQGFTQVNKCDFTAGGGMFVCTGLCLTIFFSNTGICET